mmetsp:Transcript_10187/g.35444  ORF Transcript_10187/g.35444 Transcript_10187/m.35444 type:complete len:102 (+) Transcript_10187:746-1051(+)
MREQWSFSKLQAGVARRPGVGDARGGVCRRRGARRAPRRDVRGGRADVAAGMAVGTPVVLTLHDVVAVWKLVGTATVLAWRRRQRESMQAEYMDKLMAKPQ